jgi:hypothetical protein
LPVLSSKQIASLLRHITLLSVTYLAVAYISTLSRKRHDFRKKKFLKIKRVSIFSLTTVRNFSYANKNSARYDHKYT